MDKWEITAGRDVGWKKHTNWWVMTWIVNGSRKQAAFSPMHIWVMEIGLLMLPYPPNHAVLWGAKDKTAGPAGDKMYYLLPSNIWARMPMEVPKVPNVDMFFDNMPFDLTE
jgi:hypothetical protein